MHDTTWYVQYYGYPKQEIIYEGRTITMVMSTTNLRIVVKKIMLEID